MIAVALFYLFAAVTGGGALGVVLSRDVVRTAVCLLIALLGVGGIYFLLDAEFLAAVQLVVYVGGTLILIVFGVMLTSSSQFAKMTPSRTEIVAATGSGVLLLSLLVAGLLRTRFATTADAPESSVQSVGVLLLGRYLAPFELASVVLLVVLIGSAYLARNRRPHADRSPRP